LAFEASCDIVGIGAPAHIPVLLEEVLAILDPRPGEVYVDATAGLGGHAAAVAEKVGPGGMVVLNDADETAVAAATAAVRSAGHPATQIVSIRGNFAELPGRLVERGIRADMVLADLGFASTQVDDPARGFSFRADGPLDMRFDPHATPHTAADLVNRLPAGELARILTEYGEERRAGVIAAKLVAARKAEPITTTSRLAQVVHSAVGAARAAGGIDSATRTFQALRIAVNDELGVLGAFLRAVESAASQAGQDGSFLAAGARVAVITFHSLEDRLVKQSFAGMAPSGSAEPLARGPIVAQEAETAGNPRARSAKLRAVRVKSAQPGQ
jgi:16S rRNA (cytosine1402-N4)-methyltransferase